MFVYLLSFKDRPYFKIGKADSIPSRIIQLKHWGEVDFDRSLFIQGPTSKAALSLEATLKRIYRPFRVNPNRKDEGHSELFHGIHLESAKAHATNLIDLYRPQYSVVNAPQSEPVSLTGERRAAARKARQEQREARESTLAQAEAAEKAFRLEANGLRQLAVLMVDAFPVLQAEMFHVFDQVSGLHSFTLLTIAAVMASFGWQYSDYLGQVQSGHVTRHQFWAKVDSEAMVRVFIETICAGAKAPFDSKRSLKGLVLNGSIPPYSG